MFAIDTMSSRYTFVYSLKTFVDMRYMYVCMYLCLFAGVVRLNFTYRINIGRFSDDVLWVYLERNNREPIVTGVDFERIQYLKVVLILWKRGGKTWKCLTILVNSYANTYYHYVISLSIHQINTCTLVHE